MKPWQKKAAAGASAAVILASIAGYMEGNRLFPYQDVGGVLTDCQGVTMASGIPQQFGLTLQKGIALTKEQCTVLNGAAQKQAMATVDSLVYVNLTPAQEAAFADFVYNVGPGSFARSTALRDLNQGKYTRACQQLLRWVYAGGRVEPGLLKRREAEYKLCIGNFQ